MQTKISKISNINETYIDSVFKRLDSFTNKGYIFRGVPDSSFKLVPSLYRDVVNGKDGKNGKVAQDTNEKYEEIKGIINAANKTEIEKVIFPEFSFKSA